MKYTVLALISFLFVSCLSDNDKEPTDFTAQNEKQITDYIAAKNLTATATGTGLYYVVTEQGTGAQPTATSNVTVAYKGYYTNGNVFDQSKPEGISFGLQQVIKGWTEGIPFFKEGGSGMLLIPAHLGYGSFDYSGIPGGSVLIFDIKVIKVN
ncbi:FKBP-type peptidyl-prolyl cis-trans isomerase [Flavobacterium sp. K77]|uniref:FKBP-type peptidyl-prolyl cis-trans isomerase n=1 Tax=Flavobacterium sp. K77 TaxID=2910676 RepID=UPI001F2299C4|nr:FKBP-type peptidyl-prolyl cis-trans isomerase [Flavobacterium sp. K77]MCF6139819.1 FKBP-type peptidyl-prolyl cis-trans isomerase [Flavobacterium sp. K77]